MADVQYLKNFFSCILSLSKFFWRKANLVPFISFGSEAEVLKTVFHSILFILLSADPWYLTIEIILLLLWG